MTITTCGISRPYAPLRVDGRHGLFGLFCGSINLLANSFLGGATLSMLSNGPSVGCNSVCRGTITRRLHTRKFSLCCCGDGGLNRLSFLVRSHGSRILPVRIGSNGSCGHRHTVSGILTRPRCRLGANCILNPYGISIRKGMACLPMCVTNVFRGR